MAKHKIKILNKEYSSIASAAKQLCISKSSLYRLVNSDASITIEKLEELKKNFGKKKYKSKITISGKTFESISRASRELGVSKAGLIKVSKLSKTEKEFEEAVQSLIKNRRGSWKKSVTINNISFRSYTDASKHFDMTDGTIRYWVSKYGDNFQIDTEEIEFEKLEKGSWDHLVALVEKAGFTQRSDWYEKTRSHNPDILNLTKWIGQRKDYSLLKFLEDYFQVEELDWWRMKQVPEGTWTDHFRVKQYLSWLEIKLNFNKPEDWYAVTGNQFKNNFGGSLLINYSTIMEIVQIKHPGLLPWYFHTLPNGFWQNRKNHKLFLDFIANEEEISTGEQWCRIASKDLFEKYKGMALLREYKNIFECISSNFPELDLQFWRFSSSRGNWEELANQRDYINWLGNRLGIGHPTDWYAVTEQDFIDNYGITLLSRYYASSISDCIMTVLGEEHPWEKILFYKNEYKREVRLYGIISCGLPKENVIFRYKHPTLRHEISGRKIEFDVFVETLNLAIEYQGQQHYQPVERFDGKDPIKAQKSFQRRIETDQEKRDQAKANGVRLLEIKYSDWDGSLDYIIAIIKENFNINLSHEVIINNAKLRGLVNNEIFLFDE